MKSLLRAACVAVMFATASIPFAARADDASQAQKEGFGRLTIDQVKDVIAKKDGFIFDNNSKESYAKGHVPTAKWLAFDEVTAASLPADKNAKLIFYCGNEHCMACHHAAKAALGLGYTNVFIMPAGIMGWEKAKEKMEV